MNKASAKIKVPDKINRPVLPPGTHPVEIGNYLICTPEIDRMVSNVYQWIDNRAQGGIIYGRPRLGKTHAIKYLKAVLPQEFNSNIPIFHTLVRFYKNPNKDYFFTDFLKDIGHGLYSSGKPNQKADRLIKFLISKVQESGQSKIVILLDDAQRLTSVEYEWLMDIHNEVEMANARLTTILVGQEELLHQRTSFSMSHKYQLIGRFMVHKYQFSGIKSSKEIKDCLKGYDDESEFPSGSDCSYTRYFFPEAFDNGFRLHNHAKDAYSAFVELRREHGLTKNNFEIPMQYLTLVVEFILKRYGVNGLNLEMISEANWKEAIRISGYLEAELSNQGDF